MKNLLKKFRLLLLTIILSTSSIIAQQNFPHIKTFGYDYVRFIADSEKLEELEWAANKHDWIVGPKALWPSMGVDYLSEITYNTAKSANPNVKIMKYIPYLSIPPNFGDWMEAWAVDNGLNPEDIYYHYYYDTAVRQTSGEFITVPGFGGGTATTLAESRAIVKWHGWNAINPSSSTFRSAFQAISLYVISTQTTPVIYADGLFLDSFSGLADDNYWSVGLENTIELGGIGSPAEVIAQVENDLAESYVELKAYLVAETGNQSFRLEANAAHVDYIYNQRQNIFSNQNITDISVEFLFETVINTFRIVRLQQLYDDMENNGRRFFIRGQTNFASPTVIPFEFTQFILSGHYLINHPNAHFFYHKGGASNYGGVPYGQISGSHWHQNMEINIGIPISRTGTDYWGATNTNRFYEFASGSGYQTLAREYSNALVLAQFGSGGWANIGNNPITHQLDGEYYPLLDDNTNGPAVTSITLGQSEGVILLKSPVETLGINTELENTINIYPNPVKNILTINSSLEQPIESYKIYNTIGQVVEFSSSFNGNNINISHLTSGIYFLKLTSDRKEKTLKFIKE